MEKLTSFKKASEPVPKTMQRWHLYGAGFENLGKDGRAEEVDVPGYGSRELLVRQDACGLCFSDTKVIHLGPNHPRMNGRDLSRDPVTLGHEVSCTVVGVGKHIEDRFSLGDRFVVQADVFYQGKSMAYGYAIKGGLAEYSVIPQAMIDGDEGCYLLPVAPNTGYVEAALTEPWACVVSAYGQMHRAGILAGGDMLILGGNNTARDYDWSGLFSEERKPNNVVAYGLKDVAGAGLAARLSALRVPMMVALVSDWNKIEQCGGFDDIIVLGMAPPARIEAAARCMRDHAILNLVCDRPFKRKLAFDIGRIHYNGHHTLGTRTNRPADAYVEARTADLLPGGIAWFVGAGGPMGQMHVQRAVQHPEPPRRIVATDVDPVRLASVAAKFQQIARARGIDLVTLNPTALDDAAFDAELTRLAEGVGYDDIVSQVPSVSVTEHAAQFLAVGGWFNIFAGVARGTMAELDADRIAQDRCRFIGSSGSSLADMRNTLARVERHELSTNASLAAIGGMAAVAEGLCAVKEGWFPGKTLIFPLIRNLPLTPLAKLKETLPTVYSRLLDGKFWTVEAEEELLRLKLTQA